jgi:hypothetical protein
MYYMYHKRLKSFFSFFIMTATTPTVNSPFLNSNTLTRSEFPVSDTIIGSGYGWLSAAYRGLVVRFF